MTLLKMAQGSIMTSDHLPSCELTVSDPKRVGPKSCQFLFHLSVNEKLLFHVERRKLLSKTQRQKGTVILLAAI